LDCSFSAPETGPTPLTMLARSQLLLGFIVAICAWCGGALRAMEEPPPLDTPFKNVLLVVHCLQTEDICRQRKPLFSGYRKFFPDVMYITARDCPKHGTAPHPCMAELMEGRAAHRDGIFYMHFDALIRPRLLGVGFDTNSLGSFHGDRTCRIDKEGAQVDCSWDGWGAHTTGQRFREAVRELREKSADFRALDDRHFYLGVDDIFYLPRSVFPMYATLVEPFNRRNVHKEMAGATIRHFLRVLTGVNLVSLACTGGCCDEVEHKVLLRADFRCGHPIRLMNQNVPRVVPEAISMFHQAEASDPPLDVLSQLVDEALA